MMNSLEDAIFIRENPHIMIGFILTALFFLLHAFFGGTFFLIMGIIYLVISLYLIYRFMPRLILGYISVCVIGFTLAFYLILKESNILVAGFTLVLVIITAWYASISERQFQVMESGKNGRYLAEISRSVFSPMQIDLKRIKRFIQFGFGVQGWNPIKLVFNKMMPPNFYLNDDIEIIPEHPHDEDTEGFLVVRSAKQLLKIPDPALKCNLPKISSLATEYDTYFNQMNEALANISNEIPNIWPSFRTKCAELDRENILAGSEMNYQFIFKFLLSKSVIIEHRDAHGDHSVCSYDDTDNSVRILSGEREIGGNFFWVRQLEFFRDNKEELLRWISTTQLNGNFISYLEGRSNFCRVIDELITSIDELLLDWKLNHYLIEDELHSKIKKLPT
jgi:hypothetical protein